MSNTRELTPLEKANLVLTLANDEAKSNIRHYGNTGQVLQKLHDVTQELIKDLSDTKKIQRIYAVEKPEPQPKRLGLQPR